MKMYASSGVIPDGVQKALIVWVSMGVPYTHMSNPLWRGFHCNEGTSREVCMVRARGAI